MLSKPQQQMRCQSLVKDRSRQCSKSAQRGTEFCFHHKFEQFDAFSSEDSYLVDDSDGVSDNGSWDDVKEEEHDVSDKEAAEASHKGTHKPEGSARRGATKKRNHVALAGPVSKAAGNKTSEKKPLDNKISRNDAAAVVLRALKDANKSSSASSKDTIDLLTYILEKLIV